MSYQKKACLAPAEPTFFWSPTIKYNLIYEDNRIQFYSWCHTKKKLGWAGASQVFFFYDNDKDLKAYFCMSLLKFSWYLLHEMEGMLIFVRSSFVVKIWVQYFLLKWLFLSQRKLIENEIRRHGLEMKDYISFKTGF